ncbi:MAG: hypothetical protein Q9166_007474 [cf. Caloplaca sp. 2 TL-2023]
MELVVPQIRKGGVDTGFFKLHPSVTPKVIVEAAAAGITGVKMCPQGVTTNSEAGVAADFLKDYCPVFAAMEYFDLVLNLHGEIPGALPSDGIPREETFLPQLKRLHEKFPRLRILAGTFTAQYLYLTGNISQVDALAYCKPIPQTPLDRDALIKALVILAPQEAIERGVIEEHEVTQERLERFLSRSGRRFYKLPNPTAEDTPKIVLERKGETLPTKAYGTRSQFALALLEDFHPAFVVWIRQATSASTLATSV